MHRIMYDVQYEGGTVVPTWYAVRLAVFALLSVALTMAVGFSSHCWVADVESQSCTHLTFTCFLSNTSTKAGCR